jgi:FSR family fosmidomycin resistance protein-like MFS transporter
VLRIELTLSYSQVGLLLGVPYMVSALIEPFIVLLGDTNLCNGLIILDGLGISVAMILIATADSFLLLLCAMVISFPEGFHYAVPGNLHAPKTEGASHK